MKIVHAFDYQNGRYVGPVELGPGDQSPLEPGVYLIPGNCTERQPPPAEEGQVAVWNGEDWQLQSIPQKPAEEEEDSQVTINREATAYLANTDWYVIRKLETGQAIPAEVLEQRQHARTRIN